MTQRDYDALVFIGRFQPIHIGHEAVIRFALEKASQVVILIGSENEPRSIKNSWTFEEREHMIRSLFKFEIAQDRILIAPLGNHGSDERWAADVREEVNFALQKRWGHIATDETLKKLKIGITGFAKDKSSEYLNWFPEWDKVLHETQVGTFNATDIRHGYFSKTPILPTLICSPPILEYLTEFHKTAEYQWVLGEKLSLDANAKLWENIPYNKGKPHMITADAVVQQNKQVLLIRRGAFPGKGLLALPGGFLDVYKDNSLRDAAVRELKEETKISDDRGEIPAGRLGSFIRDDQTTVFDAPDRDLRGRVVTHAYRFDLPDGPQYTIKASDDAMIGSAKWYPIGPDLNPRDFYADHYHILAKFFGL